MTLTTQNPRTTARATQIPPHTHGDSENRQPSLPGTENPHPDKQRNQKSEYQANDQPENTKPPRIGVFYFSQIDYTHDCLLPKDDTNALVPFPRSGGKVVS